MYIIFVIYLATVYASSHEKYIDLLPEQEKQEFLNRVLRRIMDTVQPNVRNTNLSSKELTDEHLQTHNDFVQTILKQETENLNDGKNDQINTKYSNEWGLDVKPLRTIQREHDLVHVDLTVDGDNRRTYTENSTEISAENIKNNIMQSKSPVLKRSVKVVDTNINIQEKQLPISTYNNEYMIDEALQPNKSSDMDENMQLTSQASNIATVTDFENLSDKPVTTSLPNKIKNNVLTPMLFINKNENVEKKITAQSVLNSHHTTEETNKYSGVTLSKMIKSSFKMDILQTNPKNNATEKNIIYIKTFTEKPILNEGYNTKNIEERNYSFKIYATTASYISDESKINEPKDNIIQRLNISKIELNKTYHNYQPKSRYNSTLLTDKVNKEITKKNIYIDIDTLINKGSTTKYLASNLNDINMKTEKSGHMITNSPKFLSDLAIKALNNVKSKYQDGDIRNKKRGEYKNFIKLQKKYRQEMLGKYSENDSKHYRVYEIDWPSSEKYDTPALRNLEAIADQPYFVPTYEYSPNRAYYNPGNRYGPSEGDENSMHNLRLGEESKDGNNSKFVLDLNGSVKKFALYYVHPKNSTDSPNNSNQSKLHKKMKKEISYTTSDEYTNEKNIHIPDSHESLHPFNNMKDGLKSHIQAIREVLQNSGNFGAVNKNEYKYKDILHNADNVKDKKKSVRSQGEKKTLIIFKFDGHKIAAIAPYLKRWQTSKRKSKNKGVAKNNTNLLNTITKIINVTDEKDVFINLQKLRDMNMTLMRRKNDVKLGVYFKVLKDLIVDDSKALKQYNWLATTVQIQSALMKLKNLIYRVRMSEPIHPSDLQILKYMIFLHNITLEVRDANSYGNKLRKKLLPKNKNKHNKIVKEKGLFNRVWLYRTTHLPDLNSKDGLTKLEDFIMDIENDLYDLHESLKNIAHITNYKNQNWYRNLKDLYLTTDMKNLRELLLHLSVARLVELVESSCENGLEEGFLKYIKTHRKEAMETIKEIAFVVRILDEINYKDFG